ncbi:hypothetical protein DUI87_06519 [Hirundo rustica rustica]|uniref:Integrase-type domain-containing protein n=1 Tax=Hirundo rustica rustica TaxID=333673 RepID=A0A3M0KTF3_HIRRU|nr:hypothetical protein DUI87_06519 [Hirundo rustica rustica]
MVKDPETGRVEGSHKLVTWGRGYACMSTPTGPKWIPSKWVKPYVPKVSGSRKALGELAHLECWVAKQANLTTDALANLLSDEEITRQATLQNRAAIDYLLLLHGHRCEELEGLCCFNLTSKAKDVHMAIQKIRDMVYNIKRETDDWLSGLFANLGISGWASSIIKTILLGVFILLLVILAFGIIKKMLFNMISVATHSPSINQVVLPPALDFEESMELEEVSEETPEDERNPNKRSTDWGGPPNNHGSLKATVAIMDNISWEDDSWISFEQRHTKNTDSALYMDHVAPLCGKDRGNSQAENAAKDKTFLWEGMASGFIAKERHLMEAIKRPCSLEGCKRNHHNHQHGFTTGKSCLTNLRAFHSGMAEWVDEQGAVDVV